MERRIALRHQPPRIDMHPPYDFSFLKERDIPALHSTFLEAFSDYLVPIKLSREELNIKLKREGVELTFCVGAFHEKKLVGFIMTGLGEWQGKPTAYNAGTGVVPEHRGHRLTQRMYEFLIPKLKESGIEQCLLEVIQQNESALRAYKNIGFQTTRALECFRAMKQDLILSKEEAKRITIKQAPKPNWQAYPDFCDIHPTWQNTKQAFKLNPDKKTVLEAYFEDKLLVGYAAFYPNSGAIPQLAVHQSYRNQGVATALLKEVVKQVQAPALLFINVDASCPVFLEYLRRSYFTHIMRQYEMLLPLY